MACRTPTASGLMTSNSSRPRDWPEGDLMPDPADEVTAKPGRPRTVAVTIWVLEHAQDVVTVTVGVVLIALAAVLVVDGLVGFFHTVHTARQPVPVAATALLDQFLLVLILVEIVHTVVLSLRAHRLAAQPFIIVGLVAVVASFIAVSWFERRVSQAQTSG